MKRLRREKPRSMCVRWGVSEAAVSKRRETHKMKSGSALSARACAGQPLVAPDTRARPRRPD